MESRENETSFPVWVGSLAESVNKPVLMMYFQKFGPILYLKIMKDTATGKSKGFGFVNYSNQEDAERAADQMNNVEICGKKIKTKGPHDQPIKSFISSESKLNIKNLTDCYYFTQFGECKGFGEVSTGKTCQYRHFDLIQKTVEVCPNWGNKSCTNLQCLKLHPSQRHYKYKDDSTAKLNSINTPVSHSGINVVPIGVFWDIENCQVPKNKSALAIVKKLRDRYYPGRKEAEFICVCDTKKEKEDVLDDLNKAQVNVIHINASSKNAADLKLMQQLRRFALSNPSPATVLLLSGDINFVNDLSDLRYRHNLHIILLHNKQASQALLQCAHESECFDVFTDRILPHTPMLMTSETRESNQLAVFNIPHCKTISFERITQRLNLLSQNTGGKVIQVKALKSPSNNKAIINFPNVDCARRALQRMNGENVFGYTINVSFHFEKNKKIKNNKEKFQAEQPREHEDIENQTRSNSANGAYTNLKKFSSPSTPILNSVHGNSCRKKGLNKQNTNQNKVLNEEFAFKRNQNVAKFMPPLIENNKQNDISCTPLIGVFPFGMPALSNVNPVLPNSLPPFDTTENNGITIQVSNLDKSIDFKNIKRGLYFLFQKFSKVLHITQGQSFSKTLNALVTVANMHDAQLCFSKLDNRLLFNRPIKLTIKSQLNKDNISFVKMKENVEAILCKTVSGWLPLQDFLSGYKVKYEQAFYVSNFKHMKDLIYIDGKPGYQFICLLSFCVGLTLKPDIDFQGKLEDILLSHNRKVPLASLPGLYWSYQQELLPLCNDGIPLQHVLSKNITLVGFPGSQEVFHKKLPAVNEYHQDQSGTLPDDPAMVKLKVEGYSLSSFQSDIILLLKMSPKFEIPWNHFSPNYYQFFGCELCVQDFECNDLEELISKVSEIVQVEIRNNNRVVTFTLNFKLQILNEELHSLIMSCNKLPVNSLITKYYCFFGRKFVSANFGFDSLQSLLSSLQHPFKVKVFREKKYLSLLENIVAPHLPNYYTDMFRKPFPLENLKTTTFYDIAPSNFLSIGDGSNRILMSKENCRCKLRSILLENFLYSCEKFSTNSLEISNNFKKFGDIFKPEELNDIFGLCGHPSFKVCNNDISLTQSAACKMFEHDIISLLHEEPELNLKLDDIIGKYQKMFCRTLKVTDFGYTTVHALCANLTGGIVVVKTINNENLVELGSLGKIYFKCKSVVDFHHGALMLCNFATEYHKMHGTQIKLADYGFKKILDLITCFHKIFLVHTEEKKKLIISIEHLSNSISQGSDEDVEIDKNLQLDQLKFDVNSEDSDDDVDVDKNMQLDQLKFDVNSEDSDEDVDIDKNLQLDQLKFDVNSEDSDDDVDVDKNMQLDQLKFDVNSEDSDEDVDIDKNLQLDQLKFDVNSEDLLAFDDDGKADVLSDLMENELANPLEWWMEPNPNLSDSVLEPELSQNVVYDLISFTEFEDNQNINNGGSDDFGKADSVKSLHSHQVNDLADVFSHETPIEKIANNFVESESEVESESFQSFNHYSCLSSSTSTSVAGELQKTQNSNGLNTSEKISVRPKLAANFSKF